MQIKAKIACAGDEGLSQFPGLPCHIEELGDGRGGIDESKLRAALANDQINIGSRDRKATLVFGAELISRVTMLLEKIVDAVNSDGSFAASLVDEDSSTHRKGKADRNLRKGRFVFCKTVVTSCLDGIHVRISVENPKSVCGNAILFAYEYAMLTAQAVIGIAEDIPKANVVMIDGEGASDLFAESRKVMYEGSEMRRRSSLRVYRENCPNRRADFCSPPCFGCELYRDGRCDINKLSETESADKD